MAATYTKPTKIPRWADTSLNVTEPSSGKKDTGWIVNEIPPSSYENWRTRTIGEWFKWLDERLFDGGSADDFVIKEPGGGTVAVEFDSTGAYFPNREIIVGPSAEIEIAETPGGDTRMNFGANALFYYDMTDENMELQLESLTIGRFMWTKDTADGESQFVLNNVSGDDYPCVGFDSNNSTFFVALKRGAADETVDDSGQFEVSNVGYVFVRNNTAGTATLGPRLSLVNVNRTTTDTWRLEQYNDELLLKSFANGTSLEFTYLRFSESGEFIEIGDSLDLLPEDDYLVGEVNLGSATKRFEGVHAGFIYEHAAGLWYGYGAASYNINSTSGVIVTPRTAVEDQQISVNGSGRITFNKNGLYKIDCTFVIDEVVLGSGGEAAKGLFEFQKNGVAASNQDYSIDFPIAYTSPQPVHIINVQWVVEITAYATDYAEVFAQLRTRVDNEEFDIDTESRMTVTRVRTDP
jgi:hypothetical protein